MPEIVLEKLLDLKNGQIEGDYLLLKNFPIDHSLIPTPSDYFTMWDKKKSFTTEAVGVGIASILGEVFGYKNQKNGNLIQNNYPVFQTKRTISNESSDILPFHTEDIHVHPFHPDFVLLYCLRGCRENKAKTYLLHSEDIVKNLTSDIIEGLSQDHFYIPPQILLRKKLIAMVKLCPYWELLKRNLQLNILLEQKQSQEEEKNA